MRPTTRKAIAQRPAQHSEVIVWNEAPSQPDTDRTVIVRLANTPGTWPAFVQLGRWVNAIDGAAIDEAVLRWAEQPKGDAFQLPAIQPNQADDHVATLSKTERGYIDLTFTAQGRKLPQGHYRLCALPGAPE